MKAVVEAIAQVVARLPLSFLEAWGWFAYLVGGLLALLAFGRFTLARDRWALTREPFRWDGLAVACLVVTFAGESPAWPPVARLLAERGWAVEMRMIDGELAFPDEEPGETWREIRVGAQGAMVSVRRRDREVAVVAWGNAEGAQRLLWQRLAWAFAQAGGGTVQTESGPLGAEGFLAQAGATG